MGSYFPIFLSYFPLTNNLFSFDLFYFGNQILENIEKYFSEEYFPQTNEDRKIISKMVFLTSFISQIFLYLILNSKLT